MFLHFSHPNNFYKMFIDKFQSITETQNKYYVLGAPKGFKNNVENIDWDVEKIVALIENTPQCKAVFIHYLAPFYLDIIKRLDPKIKVVWMFFGSDGFQNKALLGSFYEPKTKAFLNKYTNGIRFRMAYKPWNFIKEFKAYKRDLNRFKEAINVDLSKFQRVDYFCHYIEEDYDIIKEITGFSAKLLPFSYGTHEEYKPTQFKEGENILIGNSGDFTNNHLDVFELLKGKNLSNKKIYTPLSYGGNPYYCKEIVTKAGKSIFGSNFIPLHNYMALDDYNEIISSCHYTIFYHKRSQAFGNIITAILSRNKIFMHPESSLKKHLDSLNITTFSLEEDNFKEKLSAEVSKRNIENISKAYSKEITLERYKNIETEILKVN